MTVDDEIENVVGNLPSFLKPSLKLFLSVDIVGSTSFKQSKSSSDDIDSVTSFQPWFGPIFLFYRTFEQIFKQEWISLSTEIAEKRGWDLGPPPELWKAVGDELIYRKDLTDHRQALICIMSWRAALREYRDQIKRASKSLDLKSGAWLAGFPVNNSEVVLQSNLGSTDETIEQSIDDPIVSNLNLLEKYADNPVGLMKDCIGPSIDTGFRICSLATPRKMVVSLDLALLLADTMGREHPDDLSLPALFYEGGRIFKGVADGDPYPIFWVDIFGNKLANAEDELLGVEAADNGKVRNFCLLYVEQSTNQHIMKPYIWHNPDKFFGELPIGHIKRLQRLKDYWGGELARRKIELDAQMTQSDSDAPSDRVVLTGSLANYIREKMRETSKPGPS